MPIFETKVKYEANDGVSAQNVERDVRQVLQRTVRLIDVDTRRLE